MTSYLCIGGPYDGESLDGCGNRLRIARPPDVSLPIVPFHIAEEYTYLLTDYVYSDMPLSVWQWEHLTAEEALDLLHHHLSGEPLAARTVITTMQCACGQHSYAYIAHQDVYECTHCGTWYARHECRNGRTTLIREQRPIPRTETVDKEVDYTAVDGMTLDEGFAALAQIVKERRDGGSD